uniref:Neogenin n=1 Tax=Cacopsylla melanoneura TaxID=428564 RepID=A0A8D9AVD2_9HEMI
MLNSLHYLILFYSIGVHNVFGAGITFLLEPRDTTVSPGMSVVLNCKAELRTPSGNKPAQIKWKNLIDGEVTRPAAANGSLILTKLFTSEDARDIEQFQCIASVDNVGTAVSRVASVKRSVAPEFLQQPGNMTSYEGQIAQFPCLVSPNLHARISWLKNKRPFVMAEAQESRMIILPSGTLEIEYVEASDSGVYQCNVSIPGSSRLSDEAYLTVNSPTDLSGHTVPPTFVSKPQNLQVGEGETLTLDCAANGVPRPSITWLKDGLDIDLDDLDSRFSKVGTGSLQITSLQAEDEGNYVCRAGNKEDSVDASATLHVQVPPKFTKLPEDMQARSKDDVELQCRVFGKPQPKVSWLKNGELITQNDYIQISGNNNIRIQGTIKLDSGMFQCIASNLAGNIQASSLLTISDMDSSPSTPPNQLVSTMVTSSPLDSSTGSIEALNESSVLPSAPQSLNAYMVGPRSVALRWQPPALLRGDVLVYCVLYKRDGSDRERAMNATAKAEESIVQGLHPNTSYTFRVVAYNNKGAGLASNPLPVKTEPEDHVPSPPLNLNIPVVGTSSLLVTWEKPAVTNGEIKHYTVYYLEEDTSVERHVVTSQLSYELTGLSHFTLYSVWVVAHNNNGASTTSLELSVQTLSDKPSEPPANVTLEASGASSITVKWHPPSRKGQNGIITGYKLRYKKKDKKDKGETVTTAGDRRLFVISGLNKSTTYQVKLWAMNVNGSGPPTDWFSSETFSQDLGEFTVPDIPASLKARPGGASSILVSWTPPEDQSIMVRGFTLGWGKGVPDEFVKQILDVKQRSDEITGLEPNSDYVISLRAFNEMGDGPQRYEYLRTRNEPPPQAPKALIPPMGLKADVLSPYSMRVSWIDTTLAEQFQQHGEEGRHYLVRYTHLLGAPYPRYKFVNSSVPSVEVNELKPNTQYEFTVKVVRSKKESEWSMIVLNTTQEAAPASAPRDLTVVSKEGDPSVLNLNWQPPKSANGQISGYSILYSSDPITDQWTEESVVGDKMSTNVRGLEPGRIYYFKIKARNSAGSSPYSSTVTWTTPTDIPGNVSGNAQVSNTLILYIVVGTCVAFIFYVVAVVVALCCCKMNSNTERSKKGYVKGSTGVKQQSPAAAQIHPPDLWIHHDQMELKAIEKSSQGSLDLAPTTVIQGEYEPPPVKTSSLNASTPSSNNSLDKHHRAFATSYIGMSQTPSEARPLYPRSQYTGGTTRAHVTVDASGAVDSAYVVHTGLDTNPGPNYGTPHVHPPAHPVAHPVPPTVVDGKVKPRQGHPLKSFTVPAPPPPTSSAPTTPQQKHVLTVRPQGTSSPYKKSSQSALWPSALSESAELSPLKGSYSTEELTQEMANLEGLMKDLDAITASEFNC